MRPEQPIAIVGATLVPTVAGQRAPEGTVVVEAGTITRIAPDVDTAGMHVVDGTGRYLAPALADMHVHFWDAGEAPMYLANGVTTVRNMWGAPFHLAWQQQVERGAVPGPRVVTTSPIVDGVRADGMPMWPGSTPLADPRDADALVQQLAERGYQQIKAYSFLAPDALAALGTAAKRAGIPLVGHCPATMTFEAAITAGQVCFEHLTAIGNGHLRDGMALPNDPLGARVALAEHLDDISIRDLAKRMADGQIWNCPTTVVWNALTIEDHAAALTDPLLRFESAAMLASWHPDLDPRTGGADADVLAPMARRANQRLLDVVGILHDEGAPLMIGTDTPMPFVLQGFAVHDELDTFVRAGLSPLEALRCATSEPARFLGETGQWGVVAEGARAELLLLDRNPAADVRALRDPAVVFTNGFVLHRENLAAMLDERARSVAPTDGPPTLPELPPARGEVARSGTLIERIGGAYAGCCSFRHSTSPNGGLEIDEVFEPAPGEGIPTRRTRIELDHARVITRAEIRKETPAGARVLNAERADGRYLLEIRDPDGHVEHAELEASALVPSERVALSALPLLADRKGADALDADGRVARISVSAGSDATTIEIERYGERTELDLQARDLLLEALTEQDWRGLRTITPMPTHPASESPPAS